ncbi:MAG: Ig-like domain-containing protein, partial [Acidobacteriota bacterium]|nr:Ig-like domain-containing protein [Acidobacteriota bacterium]
MYKLLFAFAFAVPCGAASTLQILPAAVTLSGPEARHQLLAEATVADHQEDWTRQAKWTSSDPSVATVDQTGQIKPVSDGKTRITAETQGQTASAQVTVQSSHDAFTWNFRNHVIPVLTKAGCNQGACHGALAGKNGFKLTLRGYDPEVDYDTLTRQSAGRRVSLLQPAHSLMLLKPTMAVPHGGGKRFDTNSLEYRVIAEWIAAGAPAPADSDPAVTGLEVYPASAALKPGAEQQLVVRARYSDGKIQDVTRWVKFSSSDEGVATVDDFGHVKMNGSGETAITLYYSSRVLYSRLSVPYQVPVKPEVYTSFKRNNYIDELVLAKLQKLHLAPSAPANDATFIRRLYLDSMGVLPTAEEVEIFLASKEPDKRAKLIEGVFARDEFVDYWAY